MADTDTLGFELNNVAPGDVDDAIRVATKIIEAGQWGPDAAHVLAQTVYVSEAALAEYSRRLAVVQGDQ